MKRLLAQPLIQAGLVLGLGFGGFADGIVLHQILGWHHLVCVTAHCQAATIEQFKIQNTQDGWFHLALWVICLAGTMRLFHSLRQPAPAGHGRALVGAMLAGWGLFQLVEGIVDHHLLGIHHVLPGHPNQFAFDLMFLAAGVVFLLIGACLMREPRH